MQAPSPSTAFTARGDANAPSLAPSPITVTAEISSMPNPVLLICVAVGSVLLAVLTLVIVAVFLWRRNNLRYSAESPQPPAKEDKTVMACRKPVVIINPSEDDISYGRKESSYFPSFFRLGRRSMNADDSESKLPAAAEGGYYVRGKPGFFEVDLELGGGMSDPRDLAEEKLDCNGMTKVDSMLSINDSSICTSSCNLDTCCRSYPFDLDKLDTTKPEEKPLPPP